MVNGYDKQCCTQNLLSEVYVYVDCVLVIKFRASDSIFHRNFAQYCEVREWDACVLLLLPIGSL